MTTNVLDTKYQKSPDFPPDKSDLWPFAVEHDGWMLAHNSIRKEIEDMIEALEASKKRGGALQEWEVACVTTAWKTHYLHIHSHHSNEDALITPYYGALQEWEVACVTTAWKTHYLHIHSHHSNEDDMLTPYLETRINYPDKLTADHKELVAKLDRIDAIVESLGQKEEEGNLSGLTEEMLSELREYQGLMLPHLKEEEDEGLALSRAYFEPHEIGEITQKIIAGSPKIEMGSFIVCQGIDEFRNGFMKRHQIPAVAWDAQFKDCATVFDKDFTKPVEALKTGIQIEQEEKDAGSTTIQTTLVSDAVDIGKHQEP
eukprot:CAMPEP_0113634670 /NCGR_PEP_ID=MMETSP0017_2-20120614/18060_1 /TAXON_ID=2856 /ORGANISM="Cylindrotheca closterium" /LENGTH=314 /DNA_ID=CAMNT_0000545393 /DNA_START=18 /DNA_END=962 /DNA_ORIENTATION=- /assembly_acc=CAM_ASM_000147